MKNPDDDTIDERILKKIAAEFPDDPALQQVLLACKRVSALAEAEGLSVFEYVKKKYPADTKAKPEYSLPIARSAASEPDRFLTSTIPMHGIPADGRNRTISFPGSRKTAQIQNSRYESFRALSNCMCPTPQMDSSARCQRRDRFRQQLLDRRE